MSKVFIPVVVKPAGPAEEREARLWQVRCRLASGSELRNARDLDRQGLVPTVDPLRNFSGYDSGTKALGAVKNLLGAEASASPGQWGDLELALRKRRLESAEGAGWAGRIEEHSSDLGLALALLAGLFGAKVKMLAATGELGDSADAHAEGDTPVKPVGEVPAKLEEVLRKKRGGGALRRLEAVFTPWHYLTAKGELEWVRHLPVVQELEAEGVAVHPVCSLAEAAKILGLDANGPEAAQEAILAHESRRAMAAWVWRCSAATGFLGASLAAFSLASFLDRPIPLEWQVLAGPDAGPAFTCLRADRPNPERENWLAPASGGAELIVPPSGPGRDVRLHWRVRLGRSEETRSWQHRLLKTFGYQGYYLAAALVGKSGVSDYTLFEPRAAESSGDPARRQPGALWSHWLKLGEAAEDSRLILLARRWSWSRNGFDIDDLKRGIKPKEGGLDLQAAEHYLASQADGNKRFAFQTRPGAPGCPAAD